MKSIRKMIVICLCLLLLGGCAKKQNAAALIGRPEADAHAFFGVTAAQGQLMLESDKSRNVYFEQTNLSNARVVIRTYDGAVTEIMFILDQLDPAKAMLEKLYADACALHGKPHPMYEDALGKLMATFDEDKKFTGDFRTVWGTKKPITISDGAAERIFVRWTRLTAQTLLGYPDSYPTLPEDAITIAVGGYFDPVQ